MLASSLMAARMAAYVLLLCAYLNAVCAKKATTKLSLDALRLPRSLGSFSLPDAAFAKVISKDLVLTTFSADPFSQGQVLSVRNIGKFVKNMSAAEPQVLETGDVKLHWPNELTAVPTSGTNLEPGFLVGDGFLVPLKSTGSIAYVNYAASLAATSEGALPAVKLTADKSGWFYHVALWADVNQDGLLDVVTARATSPTFGKAQGELIWLEHPAARSPMTFPWREHHLADGPDVQIALLPLNGTSAPFAIFAAEFFSQRLTVFEVGADGIIANSQVIDDTVGKLYDVFPTNLVGRSGFRHLVVTNYSYGSDGALMVYEIPKDIFSGSYQRHVVYNHFANEQYAPGSGAPGFVCPHFPDSMSLQQNIFVCGDGSEALYLFTPSSSASGSEQFQNASSYEIAWSKYYASTIGGITSEDIDDDGFEEVFVCDYNKGLVRVWTYAPE